jgi:Ca2+-binding EF-hand superfamily protein
MRSMVINMEEAKLQTLSQIKAFLDGTSEVTFRVSKGARNQFIERVFKRFGYAPHGRVDKGVLLRYIERMTGLSRQQVTRLVRQYRKDGKLSKHPQRVAQKTASLAVTQRRT